MSDRPPSQQTRRREDLDAGSTTAQIFVADEQDDDDQRWPVDEPRWAALGAAVLAARGIDGELSVLFVDEQRMVELNTQFMGQSGSTDVLAFPIDGGDPSPGIGVPRLLGDVVICPAVAARNAPEHAGSYDDEVALLLVHGVLHLLGSDHATETDRVAMQRQERALLDEHYGVLARDPWT